MLIDRRSIGLHMASSKLTGVPTPFQDLNTAAIQVNMSPPLTYLDLVDPKDSASQDNEHIQNN